jgi:hypothetical protein
VGSVHADKPGRYLIRRASSPEKAGKTQLDCAGYVACIETPGQNGLLVYRIQADNQSDTKQVNAYARDVELKETNFRIPESRPISILDVSALPEDSVPRALTLAARLDTRNPPRDAAFEKLIRPVLQRAGIVDGRYVTPKTVNLTTVAKDFDRLLSKYETDSSRRTNLGGTWTLRDLAAQGTYHNGTDILSQSYYAKTVYLANAPDQSLYVNTVPVALNLRANESYIVDFPDYIPTPADGFWSLTIYDAQGYLIPNDKDVYAIGDRTGNLSYSNGDYVNALKQRNRPFSVLIQAADVPPPKNWTANWLPAPKDAGFQITLRVYHPAKELSDGSFEYPTLRKGAQIKG